MLCSADYYLVTCSQRRLLCADVCLARTSRRYQNRKYTAPSQFGIVGAANWQRRLVCAEHTAAHTIMTVTHGQRRIVGAANVGSTDQQVLPMLTKGYFRAFFLVLSCKKSAVQVRFVTDYSTPNNSRRCKTFAAPTVLLFAANTIIFCFTQGFGSVFIFYGSGSGSSGSGWRPIRIRIRIQIRIQSGSRGLMTKN